MKNIRITESERKSILRQHSSINEQAGANKTVCDIQRALGGLTIDNILGDNTYNALISVLGRGMANKEPIKKDIDPIDYVQN